MTEHTDPRIDEVRRSPPRVAAGRVFARCGRSSTAPRTRGSMTVKRRGAAVLSLEGDVSPCSPRSVTSRVPLDSGMVPDPEAIITGGHRQPRPPGRSRSTEGERDEGRRSPRDLPADHRQRSGGRLAPRSARDRGAMTRRGSFKRIVRAPDGEDRRELCGRRAPRSSPPPGRRRTRRRSCRERDSTLRERTGEGWEHWLAVLDDWGALDRSHREITRYLREELEVDGWW